MYLGGIALGVSSFLGLEQYPEPSLYTSVRVYGEGQFDNVHVLDFEFTEAEIMAIDPEVEPLFDGNTLMLATFDSKTLDAGNISGITNPITQFDINRREDDENVFTRLATVDDPTSSYVDITAKPDVTYIYQVLPKNSTEIAEPLQADPFESDFYNWILIDEDSQQYFLFNLNLNSSAFGNETDYTRYDGYDKYSQFTFGDRDFLTGSVSALVSSNDVVSGEITQTVEYLDTLRSVINNKKEKILKSRKGHVLRVVTTDYNSSILNDAIVEQPYIVSFNFTEVGEVDA